MKVAKGYKQTELGVIPEEWHFKTFGEVMKGFSSGQTPSRSVKKYYTGKIPWITSGELNYNVITDTIEKITDEAATKTHLKTIPVGTFLMAITGLEAEGTRGSCAITGVEATTNQSCMALYPNEKELTTDYLFQFYKKYGNQLAFKYCQGTKQQSYTGKIAKTLPIIIPTTIEEQNAITNALNETDSLIADLEKLIAKKQNIKQATMQVLLTGKKRLKGFKGEWEKISLRQIGDTYGGLSGKTKKDFENGKFAFITFMNVMKNPVIDTTIFEMVNLSAGENQNKVQKGDLLLNGSSETPEEVGMCSVLLKDYPDLYLNSFCFGFRLKKELKNDALFLSYYFRSKQGRKLFYSLAQGATRYNLSKSNFLQLEISLPEPEEQKELASVFLDIDNEIEALQQQLAKYKLMKEGMMQDLLTGKVRLI